MNRQRDTAASRGGRFEWGSYGFLAGIIVGLLLGWMFHGFVGAVVRVALVAAIFVPIVVASLVWRRIVAPWLRRPVTGREVWPGGAIETTSVVRNVTSAPHPR